MGRLMSYTKKIEVFGVMVSAQDAEDFLSSMPVRPCEVCSNNLWDVTVGHPTAEEYLALWTTKNQAELGANHLPIYTAACTKCGFVRTFLTYHLTQWVKERSAQNG